MRPTPPPLQSHAPAPPFRLLAISPASALVLLLCFWLVGYLITSAVLYFIIYKLPDTEPALRIGSVLQDLILFILPAIATAMLSTRLPATLLGLVERPRFITVIFAFATLIISIPAMNLLIQINQSLSLPESMSAIEHWMRASEANAADSINTILGGSDVGSLIISLLIVGILAGLSEELLFRGALQRLLMACRIGHHGAIWLAAFIFSAVHMQFFGFVPRLLLGAFFGYLFYWSGSLWLPVLCSIIVNNMMYVISRWSALRQGVEFSDGIGENISSAHLMFAAASAIFTVLFIIILRRSCSSSHARAKHQV